MDNAPSTTARRTKPRERNSLLKKYYGLKDTSAPNQTPVIEENADPLDLGLY